MVINMDETRLRTIEQLEEFLSGCGSVAFTAAGVGGDDLPKNFGGINWWRTLASRKAKRRGRAGP